MATKRGYARRHLGGGNTLKAVTRSRRAAAGRSIGKTHPLKHAPVWRAHERRANERLLAVVEQVSERETA
jgi:hypothetical protein